MVTDPVGRDAVHIRQSNLIDGIDGPAANAPANGWRWLAAQNQLDPQSCAAYPPAGHRRPARRRRRQAPQRECDGERPDVPTARTGARALAEWTAECST